MPPPPIEIEIRPHPTKGRALYATTSFTASSAISAFTPLLLVPSTPLIASLCSYCFRPGSPRACSRCYASYYCDATCQTADWAAAHNAECKLLRRLPADRRAQLPTPVRALMRLLVAEKLQDEVRDLEGHVEQRRRGGEWQDLELMALGASSMAGKGTAQEDVRRAIELLCKIQTNAFHRYDADTGQVGIFLEPTLAMANHSCIPNAFVHFIGRGAILRAEAPIRAGDEIQISYTDYTNPLSKRKQALAQYHFECQCRRCKDDMNVYQVCATSPNINLNRHSLVQDPSQLRHAATTRNPENAVAIKAQYESTASLIASFESQQTPSSLTERRRHLRAQYRQCRSLITADLWALSPLPHILTEVSVYLAEKEDFASALAVACQVATACEPFRYVASFHPVRIMGIATLAKLLANTAPNTGALQQSITAVSTKASISETTQERLRDIDQVSLCQMLLIMVLRSVPDGFGTNWNVVDEAKVMLREIEQLPGREKEQSLISEWGQDPDNDRSQAFFEYAVVQPTNALASLAPGILRSEFDE